EVARLLERLDSRDELLEVERRGSGDGHGSSLDSAEEALLDLTDPLDALLGEAVGGDVGRDLELLGDLVDALDGVVDVLRHAESALADVAFHLDVDVDEAARVDDVVGR